VTRGHLDNNTLCNIYIIESFLGSQHRPVLLHHRIRVPLTESIEKPGWNFSSVDWESFAANIDHVVRFIPARIHTKGFQTPLELPQNVLYHVVYVRLESGL
jgi:hypothetical protein